MTRRFCSAAVPFFLLASAAFSQTPPYGLTQRVPNSSFKITTSGNALASMQLRRVFNGLAFVKPILLTHAGDGSDRIFVVEQAGIIKVFPNQDNVAGAKTFLDIRARVNDDPNEAGLLGLAFHPQYASNGKFYLYYTRGNLFSRFSEFQVSSSDRDAANPNSERILFEVQQPASNHNGGMIAFGPDGYLYLALGDGGGGGDPFRTGQDRTSLLAKILRIDVDSRSGNLAYGIPPDNPYVGNPNGWREEVWAWGFRNPWRFSFDRVTGDLWCGDVGQGAWEEVDLVVKGGNYGWSIMEGMHCYNASSCNQSGLILPVVEYSHNEGFSITGGYVYHGPRLPKLAGVYLYADYVTRKIWGLRYANGSVVANQFLVDCPANISSFGEDQAGEVFVVGHDGRIYVFEEKAGGDPPGTIPKTISASGLFTDMAQQIPAPGLIPYTVNSQLWSDGAYKTRLLALPDTTKIDFSQDGFWGFPPNAVLVKNFYLELEAGNANSRKIVETRFLVKRASGEQWDGFSYMWNDAATDANLLETSATKTFTIRDASVPGGQFEQSYYFPSRTDCSTCHAPAAGYVLGVRTAQINKPHQYDAVADNQLRSYNHIRLFTTDIGEDYANFPKLPDPLDAQMSLENRSRSYLDANCSQCHRPGGTGRVEMDLRFSTPLNATHLVNVTPVIDDLGIGDAKRIKPGAPDSSMVYLRMLNLAQFRMPPLATSLVDKKGTEVIREWIASLPRTHIDDTSQEPPAKFALQAAYPNPLFRRRTSAAAITFQLPASSAVEVVIFDVLGRRIKTLHNGPQSPGAHTVYWDATDDGGKLVSGGVYFYRMHAGAFTSTRKILLVR
ncbi:PQQ-dependent sugar dehydrogenase [candidate division KSB1 bacterium]|nr:PQQ-dependent sugar dehydrogenase [candidate division KSB1 bacterium]